MKLEISDSDHEQRVVSRSPYQEGTRRHHTANPFREFLKAHSNLMYVETVEPNFGSDSSSVESRTLPGDREKPHDDKIPDGGYGWAVVIG